MTEHETEIIETGKTDIALNDTGADLRTMAQAQTLAKGLIASGYVPKSLIEGKDPAGQISAVTISLLYLRETGINLIEGLTHIYVVNGKPTIWGGVLIKQALNHPEFDQSVYKLWYTGEGEGNNLTAHARMGRKGMAEPMEASFSMAEANQAGLGGHMYKKFPKDMLMAKPIARLIKYLGFVGTGLEMTETMPHDEAPQGPIKLPGATITVEAEPQQPVIAQHSPDMDPNIVLEPKPDPPKPKRKRRTREQMEADKAAEAQADEAPAKEEEPDTSPYNLAYFSARFKTVCEDLKIDEIELAQIVATCDGDVDMVEAHLKAFDKDSTNGN